MRYLPELDTLMREIVDSVTLSPDFGVMLRYPLGWVNADGTPYSQPTGKRIRPILLLLSAEAGGGQWRNALPAAAAVEFLHNFSLVHDDIQDASPTRHNRATVWQVWRIANAINIGDALFTLAYTALEKLSSTGLPPDILLGVWRVFNQTNLELTRGQHLDMRFENQPSVSVDEYLSMLRGKTAALTAACAQIGALIGACDEQIAAHFATFGINLGIAFQIRDDILGIWGDPETTGKSAATDILARKKSLPILYGLAKSKALVRLYARKQFGEAQVNDAVAVLDKLDARAYAEQLEAEYYQAALSALKETNLHNAAMEGLYRLTAGLFGRTF
jgi:geranylgeranyl diphosphate synthase type I